MAFLFVAFPAVASADTYWPARFRLRVAGGISSVAVVGVADERDSERAVYIYDDTGPVVSVWAEYRVRPTIGVHIFVSTTQSGGGCYEPFFCDDGMETRGGGPGLTLTIPETTLYLASSLWVGRLNAIPGTFVGIEATVGTEVELNPHATLGAAVQFMTLAGPGNVRSFGFVGTVGFK